MQIHYMGRVFKKNVNLLILTTSVFKEADIFKVTKPENFLKPIYSTEMSCPKSKSLGSVDKTAC